MVGIIGSVVKQLKKAWENKSDKNDSPDNESIKKSVAENQMILAQFEELNKKLQQDSQGNTNSAKNEEFIKNLRKEGRGF